MIKVKKLLITLPILVVFISFFVLSDSLKKAGQNKEKETKEVLSTQNEIVNTIKISIDSGDKKFDSTLSFEKDLTAFKALETLAKEKSIILDTKHYDFGIFVSGINGIVGTKEMSWIYLINGISGEKAADQTILKPGDLVEWKYQKFN